jgi:hypothetical protein
MAGSGSESDKWPSGQFQALARTWFSADQPRATAVPPCL